jgi:hypothetical protein
MPAKLATTSTGIDVTGTVTADGLTVDGNAVVTNATNATLQLQATGGNAYQLRTDVNDVFVYNATGARPLAKFAYGGDISFYEDTGTTAKLVWDSSAEVLEVPKITALSDQNTKLDLSVANTVRIFTGGTEAMRIDSSGNVGIGGAPASGRSVHAQSSGFTEFIAEKTGTNTSAIMLAADSDKGSIFTRTTANDSTAVPMTFHTGNTERMRIDSSGNVGIGTGAPTEKLHVSGTASVFKQQNNVTNWTLGLDAADQSYKIKHNGTERMRIDSSGHIGINVTSSLDQKINMADTADVGIKMTKTGSITTTMRAVGGALAFGVDGGSGTTERMRIDSSGRVGIGTSPSQPLHVDATGGTTAALFDNNGTNGDVVRVAKNGTDILKIRAEGTADVALDASGGAFIFKEGGSEAMRIDSSGNLLVGTTSQIDLGKVCIDAGTGSNGLVVDVDDATGYTNLLLDRTASDGTFISFNRGATNVGSIGSNSGANLIIGTGDTGIYFNAGSDAVHPWNIGTNAARSGAIDLGRSDDKFKDLYLSGKVASATNNFYQLNDGSFGTIIQSAGGIKFNTAGGNERARIDSSGNLLVGKTSSDIGTNGFEATSSGITRITRTSATANTNPALIINRKSSDGPLVDLKKDGTSVGSIGSRDGDIYIGTGDTQIRFSDGADDIRPASTNGAGRNAAIDLGNSSTRFKDLYLSGGVYLGGTGSANKLDDYEEGTFTPTLHRATGGDVTASYSSQVGRYTKIGRLVTVEIELAITSLTAQGSSYTMVNGLPFHYNGQAYTAMGVVTTNSVSGQVVAKCFPSGTRLFLGR